jgi:hypothetical protein
MKTLYRAGLLVAVSKEISNYQSDLDLEGVQEVRWVFENMC